MGSGLASIAGITYLSYKGHQLRAKANPEQQLQLYHPVVQSRIGVTMAYFTVACSLTAALVYAMRNSVRCLNMNPGVFAMLSIISIGGTKLMDYHENWEYKNMFYAAYVGTQACTLVPLIHKYSMPIIYDALIATGVTMGSLGVSPTMLLQISF